MSIFSLYPKDPDLKKAIRDIRKQEVKLYRKNPWFIFGLFIWLASILLATAITERLLSKLLITLSIVGLALIMDVTLTHFCHRIHKLNKNKPNKNI